MKHKFLIFTLLIITSVVGSFGVSYFNNTAERAQAAPQKLMGYMWSANIGWISLSCENMAPCTPSNTYQVTIDTGTGEINGMAWSNNLGWLNFDAGCPFGAVGTCDASMVGSNMEGWAKFVSGNANPSWDGWVSFSSNSYIGGVPLVSYGPVLSGINITGDAWGSTVVGWINFIDVVIGSAASGLQLKPSDNASLTAAQVTALPNTPLLLPGPGGFNLYWYTTDPSVVYTSCDATSSATSTWVGYTPLTPVAVVPPGNPNQTTPADFVTYTAPGVQTYTITCQKSVGGFDTATATVDSNAGAGNLFLKPKAAGDPPFPTPAAAQAAPESIFVPVGTTNVDLYWYKKPGSPVYTSCTATSAGTNFNGPVTMATFAPPVLPPNLPMTHIYSFPGTGTQTYDLSCTDGVVTDVAPTAIVTAGAACNVLSFGGINDLCPPGSPGYTPPGISWSTSNTTLDCHGTASNSPVNWLTNPPVNTSGWKDVSSYPAGTDFDLTCNGVNGGTCTSASSITLTYLQQGDPGYASCFNAVSQCSDGHDNDGDGFIDFAPGTWTVQYAASPNPAVDPGCTSPNDNSELNLKVKVKEN